VGLLDRPHCSARKSPDEMHHSTPPSCLPQDLRKTTLEWTDKRLKMVNEVLQGIRVLKFYSWEESYSKIVSGLRENEVGAIRSMGYLGAGMMPCGRNCALSLLESLTRFLIVPVLSVRPVTGVIYTAAPTLMMMVAYMVMALNTPLTPAIVFTSMRYAFRVRHSRAIVYFQCRLFFLKCRGSPILCRSRSKFFSPSYRAWGVPNRDLLFLTAFMFSFPSIFHGTVFAPQLL
jgi:hypothetical protein